MHPLQPPALLEISIQSLLQYPQLCGYPCCGKLFIGPLGDCRECQIFLYKAARCGVDTCCRTCYSPLRFLRWPEAVGGSSRLDGWQRVGSVGREACLHLVGRSALHGLQRRGLAATFAPLRAPRGHERAAGIRCRPMILDRVREAGARASHRACIRVHQNHPLKSAFHGQGQNVDRRVIDGHRCPTLPTEISVE
jgi:hypothetical protein